VALPALELISIASQLDSETSVQVISLAHMISSFYKCLPQCLIFTYSFLSQDLQRSSVVQCSFQLPGLETNPVDLANNLLGSEVDPKTSVHVICAASYDFQSLLTPCPCINY